MKRITTCILTILLIATAFAQNNEETLITIGNEKISKAEFIKAYQKNNMLSNTSEQELREYLDMFINYRLKVQEAVKMQLDTAASFKTEFGSYRDQSAQQYLTDTEVSEQLLEEAFNRSKEMIRASHILVRCNAQAAPKDTLAAYHKIMQIREKIMNGLDFNEAAFQFSEDESARDYVNPQTNRKHVGNKGEIGYFTVMDMIYPFETAAYNNPVGQVSMPIRTQFGYHLVYTQDRIPAIANIFVSQIFFKDTNALSDNDDPNILKKVNEVKTMLSQGRTFSDLAKEFSEDMATKDNGGSMSPFAPNRRPGNYVAAVLKLKPGQCSEPVPSSLGWHLLRLDSIKYATINDEFKMMLKSRVARDVRARKSKESLVAKLKNEYHYNESGKAAAMKFFKKNVPADYFQSTAVNIETLPGIEKLKPMCTFADQSVTASEFAKYVARFQGAQLKISVNEYMEQIFPNIVTERILRYEKSQLLNKYPEYRDLVAEFHDGMLLYEINSQKVWLASINDTVGLENFYETIKTNYPVDQPDDSIQYKPLSEIRAIVVGKYQEYLEKQWIQELRKNTPVTVDEKLFSTLIRK